MISFQISRTQTSTMYPAVTIQIAPESLPSTPSWMGEVAACAQVLTQVGVLKAIQEGPIHTSMTSGAREFNIAGAWLQGGRKDAFYYLAEHCTRKVNEEALCSPDKFYFSLS